MQLLRFWAVLVLALVSFTAASLIDDIIQALEDAVDCASCHLLMVPLTLLADLGDTVFVDTIVAVCQTLQVRSLSRFHSRGKFLLHC